jgi:hypothetical protein
MYSCADMRPSVRSPESMPKTNRADLQQDLQLGLHAVSEFNLSIRFADTKAGAVAALQALVLTVLAAKRDTAIDHPMILVLYGTGLLGFLCSVALLCAGQAPRLLRRRSVALPNRLAFPSLVRLPSADVLRVPDLAVQHEHVWWQATELATIAVTKYRWLYRAIVSTLVTLTVTVIWLGCVTALG